MVISVECSREVDKDKDQTVSFRFNGTEVTGDIDECLGSPEDSLW